MGTAATWVVVEDNDACLKLNHYLIGSQIRFTGFASTGFNKLRDRCLLTFNQTPRGANASAILYSLVQTAIANNLKYFEYLHYLFTELPKLGRHYEVEVLDQLLPWNSTEKITALNRPKKSVKT